MEITHLVFIKSLVSNYIAATTLAMEQSAVHGDPTTAARRNHFLRGASFVRPTNKRSAQFVQHVGVVLKLVQVEADDALHLEVQLDGPGHEGHELVVVVVPAQQVEEVTTVELIAGSFGSSSRVAACARAEVGTRAAVARGIAVDFRGVDTLL